MILWSHFFEDRACCASLIRESFLEQPEATSWGQGRAGNYLHFLEAEYYIIKVDLTITKPPQHIKGICYYFEGITLAHLL